MKQLKLHFSGFFSKTPKIKSFTFVEKNCKKEKGESKMLNLLTKICEETESEFIEKEKDSLYIFNFTEDIQVGIKATYENICFYSRIYPCPKEKREELFSYLMRANLIGNGTGKCSIGVDKEEKFLTLVHSLPYEDNYELFKESLEEFLNYLVYWEEEVKKYLR